MFEIRLFFPLFFSSKQSWMNKYVWAECVWTLPLTSGFAASENQPEKPHFDSRSVIFELDPCNGNGKVCLVYKRGKPGKNHGRHGPVVWEWPWLTLLSSHHTKGMLFPDLLRCCWVSCRCQDPENPFGPLWASPSRPSTRVFLSYCHLCHLWVTAK